MADQSNLISSVEEGLRNYKASVHTPSSRRNMVSSTKRKASYSTFRPHDGTGTSGSRVAKDKPLKRAGRGGQSCDFGALLGLVCGGASRENEDQGLLDSTGSDHYQGPDESTDKVSLSKNASKKATKALKVVGNWFIEGFAGYADLCHPAAFSPTLTIYYSDELFESSNRRT